MIFYIALGSNLGDRMRYLLDAANEIAKECRLLKTSFVYETEPEGNINQPKYLNAVILVESTKAPLEMLSFLLSIEQSLGRLRDPKNPRASRTIDADIVLYGMHGKKIFAHPLLTIPHPRMHERSFVLFPLLDIDSTLSHPILNCSLQELAVQQIDPRPVLISRTGLHHVEGY